MATSIERLPKLPKNSGRALAVFDEPGNVIPYLNVANRIRRMGWDAAPGFGHSSSYVRYATGERDKWLPVFDEVEASSIALKRMDRPPVPRQLAIDMLSALLGAFGAKADRDIMLGMLDMLEGAELADATELWSPLRVSPVVLALACRQLIATATFPPRAAELHNACGEANYTLGRAQGRCESLLGHVRRCDALLLEFDHTEWQRPYLQNPQYRPVQQRLLREHELRGNGSRDWWNEAYDDDDNPLHPFAILVKGEQDKLKAEEAKLSEAAQPKIAACRTTPVKRTHKSEGDKGDD